MSTLYVGGSGPDVGDPTVVGVGEDVAVLRGSQRPRVPERAALGRTGRWSVRLGTKPLLVCTDLLSLVLPALWVHGSVLWAVVFAAVASAVYQRAGLYRSRLTLSALDDLPTLVSGVIASGALVGFVELSRGGSTDQGRLLGLTAVLVVVLVVLGRAMAYALVRAVRRRQVVKHRVLILGAGRVAHDLAQTLIARREFGLEPIGCWDPRPLLSEAELGLPVFGPDTPLSDLIEDFDASVVLIVFGSQPESMMVDILRTCDRLSCEIFVVPRLYELQHRSPDMDEVRGTPLVRLRRPAFRSVGWRLKRLFDLVVVGLALVPLAPVLALCAIAVRLDGPGVLFRQNRVGLDGREFQLLKFRSLKPVDDTEAATRWNVSQEARMSRVGRFLRKTSLDELPQLWNVVRGEMTLVGPRPERPFFVEQFAQEFPRYLARHRVPAGLTGWAQAHGLRGDTSIADRARFDNYYIENWTLWLDIKILLLTIRSVLRREGG